MIATRIAMVDDRFNDRSFCEALQLDRENNKRMGAWQASRPRTGADKGGV